METNQFVTNWEKKRNNNNNNKETLLKHKLIIRGNKINSIRALWIELRYLVGSMLPTWTEKGPAVAENESTRLDSIRFILIRTRELKITSPPVSSLITKLLRGKKRRNAVASKGPNMQDTRTIEWKNSNTGKFISLRVSLPRSPRHLNVRV